MPRPSRPSGNQVASMARPNLAQSTLLKQTAGSAQRRLFKWTFFAEVWGELRKAEWPTREQGIRLTGIVIAIATFIGLLLGLMDVTFSFIGSLVLGS